MRIKFKGTPNFESYIGNGGTWNDGDQKEVPDHIGFQLIRDFPQNFSEISDQPKEKAMFAKHKKIIKSKHNK